MHAYNYITMYSTIMAVNLYTEAYSYSTPMREAYRFTAIIAIVLLPRGVYTVYACVWFSECVTICHNMQSHMHLGENHIIIVLYTLQCIIIN